MVEVRREPETERAMPPHSHRPGPSTAPGGSQVFDFIAHWVAAPISEAICFCDFRNESKFGPKVRSLIVSDLETSTAKVPGFLEKQRQPRVKNSENLNFPNRLSAFAYRGCISN